MAETRLVVRDLHKTYAGNWIFDRTRALRGLSFELGEGERVGLLGQNGAGKTTLLRCIAGLVRPSSGRIELFGLPPEDPRSRERLGFLAENPYFHDFVTGAEFVDLAARLVGVPAAERAERVAAALDRVGLGEARDRRIRGYSKGMKQRVGVAQALVGGPELVILDEPMTGLDPVGRRQLRDLVGGLSDQGATVLFSSHVLQDVELTCDRVIIVAEGRVVRDGQVRELLADRGGPVELTVRGLAGEDFERVLRESGAELRGRGGAGAVLRVAGEEAAEALRQAAVAAGGRVVAMVPQAASLEDLFLEEVGRARREQGREEAS